MRINIRNKFRFRLFKRSGVKKAMSLYVMIGWNLNRYDDMEPHFYAEGRLLFFGFKLIIGGDIRNIEKCQNS